MTLLRMRLLTAAACLVVAPAGAISADKPGAASPAAESAQFAFEREKFAADLDNARAKLDLDRQHLVLEQQSLDVERQKLSAEQARFPWTAAATIVPLLGVLATLGLGIWSLRRQATLQFTTQNESARLTFEIKAAEIAFGGRSPEAVLNRAKALKAMFPGRLPDQFMSGFSPDAFGGPKEPSDEKKQLLELLLKYNEKKDEVLNYWYQLFPGDSDWLKRIMKIPDLVEAGAPTSPPG